MLVPQVSESLGDQVGSTRTVSLGMQVGFSKVFLRTTVFDSLEFLRNNKLAHSAIVIQKYSRRFVAENRYIVYRIAALTIQCFVRRVDANRQIRKIKEDTAATQIQSVWRMFMAETELMASRLIAHFGQALWRGYLARKLFAILNMENQARVVQRCWRGHRVRLQYRKAINYVTSIQCCWRCKSARKTIRELRREARSLGVIAAERDRFKEESFRLRKEVETLRLSKGDAVSEVGSAAEVERLRQEVERLQTVIAQTQGSTNENSEVRSFRRQAGNSWAGNNSGYECASNYSPSLPRSIYAPYYSPSVANASDVMSSSHSIGYVPGVSSPSTSLLDTDPQHDIVDYQMRNVSDSISSPSRIFHASMSASMLRDDDDEMGEHQFGENKVFDVTPSDSSNQIRTLHSSIRDGDMRLMIETIDRSNDSLVLVNAPNADGRTALHVAVESNNLQAIRELLKRNAVSNAQDYYGNTPLHLSSKIDVVKLLLEQGNANPNIPNIDGVCTLHNTVERLDVGSVRVLLKHNAKVDVADNISWFTPLHMALLPSSQVDTLGSMELEGSRAMIVDLLCGDLLDFNMNEKDREGNTPLHYCAQLETPDATEIMSLILEKGADPKIVNGRNQQALLLLCHNQDLRRSYEAFQECLYTLLHYGADPNHQSNTGCTPLHLSLYHQDVDSAIQLIGRSAELHMLWNRPTSWIPDADPIGSSSVLALDMVSEETSIHRLLAAINGPPKWAPNRPWCMQCKSREMPSDRPLHCQHCGRHICSNCTKRALSPDFFPKSFNIYEASWVCFVCEDILVSRKEEFSNSTGVTNPASSFTAEDDRLHLI